MNSGQRWLVVLPPDGAARSVSHHCMQAFEERFGSDCKSFDTLTYRNAFHQIQRQPDEDMTVDLLNQSLIVSCLDFRATHLLVMALAPVTAFALNLLRKQGIVAIHWFYEDYRRAEYWKDVLVGYDHFFAIQRGPLQEACTKAGVQFHFLPTAAADPHHKPGASERLFDVSFVGIPSSYRIAALELLFKKNVSLAIAGSGWSSYRGILQPAIICNRWTNEKESLTIMENSKVGLNLSVSEPVERAVVHISPRVYDVLSAGCALVSENVPLLLESIDGCTFTVFNSLDDLFQTVREAIAACKSNTDILHTNRRIVAERHSFEKRVERLVEITVEQ